MRGVNTTIFAGNVGGKIMFGTTSQGNDCCSFQLASEDKHNFVTWARINAYGGLVDVCRKWVHKGCYVIVEGELMNREKSTDGQKLTEIKASQVIVPNNRAISDHDDWGREEE